MGPSTSIDGAAGAPRRALVVRIGALGDLLLTRRLTWSLSVTGFRTTLFAPARNAHILAADPWIEEVIDSETAVSAEAFGGVWPRRGDAFEAAVVISRSETLAAAARSAAARVSVVSPEPTRGDVSVALQFAQAASELATPFTGLLPDLPVNPGREKVRGAVIIHPGSGSARKNWPADRFAAVAAVLREEGHRVAWLRGPADSALPSAPPGCDALEGLGLEDVAATLSVASVFIGNDSGVAHLAAAVGAPTLALFGPTNPEVWQPDGGRVRTVRAPEGRLDQLEVTTVSALAREGAGF